MGARSGNNYLSSLRKLKAEVWIGPTRITDPTIHPALVGRARAIASLYDLQMEHPGAMTYRLDDGDRAGISFIQPRSATEVQTRGAMFRRWAEYSGGLLGATPDGVNTVVAAMAAAAPFFDASDSRCGANLRDYYRRARHNDWCAAHTILNHTVRFLELVEKGDAGIIVNGARGLSALGPLAEELLVLPPPDLREEPAADRFALCFAINCNAPGLKLRCGDAPIANRFNELECVAIFDRVLIPWDRVFLCGDVARGVTLLDATGAALNLRHQQVVRNTVAAEFRLGLAASLADGRNLLAVPRIRERLHEVVLATHLARALLHTAETRARQDRWGQWLPLAEPLEAATILLTRLAPAALA
jgi:4-hydroxyphenylacetate 3-monooxygenase